MAGYKKEEETVSKMKPTQQEVDRWLGVVIAGDLEEIEELLKDIYDQAWEDCQNAVADWYKP